MHIYNVDLTVQNQWYPQTIPQGAIGLVVRPRGNVAIDVGVAGQGTYITIPAGDPPLVINELTLRETMVLRLRCQGAANQVAEILVVT